MNISKARGIAARIWQDKEMSHLDMDVELAEKIAWMIARNVLEKKEYWTCIECGDKHNYSVDECCGRRLLK